jgi:hypothetical protein
MEVRIGDGFEEGIFFPGAFNDLSISLRPGAKVRGVAVVILYT